MSQNGYSLGRDVTLAVILSDGSSLALGKVTKWSAQQDSSQQMIKGIDGVNDHLRFYEGWSGSFEIERRSPDLDNYFAKLEANYAVGLYEPSATLQQTVTEPSGKVSQFRFEGVLLSYDNAGEWSADNSVHQTLSFIATRRVSQG